MESKKVKKTATHTPQKIKTNLLAVIQSSHVALNMSLKTDNFFYFISQDSYLPFQWQPLLPLQCLKKSLLHLRDIHVITFRP